MWTWGPDISILRKNKIYFAALLFFLLGFFTYRKAIPSDFIFDDTTRVAKVAIGEGGLRHESLPEIEMGLGSTLANVLPDRPLLMASIWLNHKIDGHNPIGYKITNIFLHCLAAFIYFLFLLESFRFFGISKNIFFPSLFVALLFLVHPLHNQAITEVIQRGVILSCIFSLLSGILALRFLIQEKWSLSFFSAMLFLLAILSKPNTFTMPLILWGFAWQAKRTKKISDLLFPMLTICALPVVFYLFFRDNFHTQSEMPQNWLTYGMVQSKVILHYLHQVIYPYGFNANYPIDTVISFSQAWPFCALHLSILATGIFLLSQKSLWGLFLVNFYLALVPESSFFPIPHVVFDHRMYFPFLFLGFPLVYFCAKFELKLARIALACMGAVCVAYLSYLNDQRNFEIRDYVSWLSSTARKYKSDHLANINALNVLFALGHQQQAESFSSELVQTFPNVPEYKILQTIIHEASGLNGRTLIVEILKDPQHSYLTFETRSNLLQYIFNHLKKQPNQLAAAEEIERIYQSQNQYLSDPRYAGFLQFQRFNQAKLHLAFRELALQKRLKPSQLELWQCCVARGVVNGMEEMQKLTQPGKIKFNSR